MKKLISIFLLSTLSPNLYSQNKPVEKVKPIITVDLNFITGGFNQSIKQINFAPAYYNHLNEGISELTCNNRKMSGFNLELGYFFDSKHTWGIGSGIMYSSKQFDLALNSFHIEYQSMDNNNDIFRQVLTSNGVLFEKVKVTNLSVPFLLKYQKHFSTKLGFNLDAGFLLTINNTSKYDANASFDYEAIYQYVTNNNNTVAVFDPNPTPSSNDLLITKDKFDASQIDGFHTQGMNVGLNVTHYNSGSIKFKPRALGWIIQPSLSYKINENISLLAGFFIMKQSFKNNEANNNYQITNKVGEYNTMLNAITQTTNFSYGMNIGLRYFFQTNKDVSKDEVIVE